MAARKSEREGKSANRGLGGGLALAGFLIVSGCSNNAADVRPPEKAPIRESSLVDEPGAFAAPSNETTTGLMATPLKAAPSDAPAHPSRQAGTSLEIINPPTRAKLKPAKIQSAKIRSAKLHSAKIINRAPESPTVRHIKRDRVNESHLHASKLDRQKTASPWLPDRKLKSKDLTQSHQTMYLKHP